ncbi:BadF/BadG/BcrA/BcrD ATPase family protein [Propionibacteriaceae bacterium Y1923]|uniref:BadF/BadG/BcrA/BcrD ATPase family protein n=1 Tax=Aestuariimicrobium sp. Y1814 TaxID=3418742 RepID=UPI003C25C569
MDSLVVAIGKSAIGMKTSDGDSISGPGIPPQLPGKPASIPMIAAQVAATFAQFETSPTPDLVVVGSTALPADEQGLGEALQLIWPDATLALYEDGVLAHAAALGGFGVVASIGSGVIVMGLDDTGALHRVDGWGPLLGDRGGAFELGRRGLVAAFEARDDVGPATALGDLAQKWLGGIDLAAAVRLLADPHQVETIAGFAEQVCEAAAQDDPVAAQLVTECAIKVAQSCAATAQRVGQQMVALRGGLTHSRTYMTALELALARFDLEILKANYDLLDVPAELLFTDPYQKHVSYLTPAPVLVSAGQAVT